MIFYYRKEKRVFIHVPKTGGNTIQTSFIQEKITDDYKIKRMQNQDGCERFDLQGVETRRKHQAFSTYLRDHPSMRSLHVLTAVRNPFERLLSFYFAPFNHAKFDPITQKTFFPKSVDFDEEKFMRLIQKTKTAAEWLSSSNDQIVLPDHLTTIKTENLENDFKKHFPDIKLTRRLNVSPYRKEALVLSQSLELRKHVEKSKHAIDYSLFY